MNRYFLDIRNFFGYTVAITSVLFAQIVLAQCGTVSLCSPVEEDILDKILHNGKQILVLSAFFIIPLIICSWAYKRNIKKWLIVLVLIIVFCLMEFLFKSILGYR